MVELYLGKDCMMLKKLMLMIAVCGFAQPARASMTKDVMVGLTGIACAVGVGTFTGGLCAAAAAQLGGAIQEQNRDFWFRFRNEAAKMAVGGGVLALVAACAGDLVPRLWPVVSLEIVSYSSVVRNLALSVVIANR